MSTKTGFIGTHQFSYTIDPSLPNGGQLVTFQNNHNIPRALFETQSKSGKLDALFDELARTRRFNAYSLAENGTPLPANAASAGALGGAPTTSSLHNGSHDLFTEAVQRWGGRNTRDGSNFPGYAPCDLTATEMEPSPFSRPQDWRSGDKIWVVEVIAPFGGAEEMVKDLKANVFTDREVTYLAVGRDGARDVRAV